MFRSERLSKAEIRQLVALLVGEVEAPRCIDTRLVHRKLVVSDALP